MTFGPSMVTRMTGGPDTPRPNPVQEEILAVLRQIRDQLRGLGEKPAA
jgi:hypothetical protein